MTKESQEVLDDIFGDCKHEELLLDNNQDSDRFTRYRCKKCNAEVNKWKKLERAKRTN